jgi:hypothetical protein
VEHYVSPFLQKEATQNVLRSLIMLEALSPVQKTYQRKRSGTNYIIVQNAEIFRQYQFLKEKEFVKENEEAFEILRNIIIFEMESSNSVNYSADMCRSCPVTYYLPILQTRVLAYLCTLLGLGFLPRFPRRLCGRSVSQRASIVLVLYKDFVHVFPAYLRVLLASCARNFNAMGVGFIFLLSLSA